MNTIQQTIQQTLDAQHGVGNTKIHTNGSIWKQVPTYPGSKKTREILIGNVNVSKSKSDEQKMMDTGYGLHD